VWEREKGESGEEDEGGLSIRSTCCDGVRTMKDG
jgi:hypothetical protein